MANKYTNPRVNVDGLDEITVAAGTTAPISDTFLLSTKDASVGVVCDTWVTAVSGTVTMHFDSSMNPDIYGWTSLKSTNISATGINSIAILGRDADVGDMPLRPYARLRVVAESGENVTISDVRRSYLAD